MMVGLLGAVGGGLATFLYFRAQSAHAAMMGQQWSPTPAPPAMTPPPAITPTTTPTITCDANTIATLVNTLTSLQNSTPVNRTGYNAIATVLTSCGIPTPQLTG